MIKLNNKNITYVAMADTNNSIKAPKEIWYADTNNSVKLVYRRKDALIEGEDYEVHQWLVDNRIDGNYAYIQGIEYDLWNNHLQMMIGQSSRGSNRFFTYTDGNNCVLQMYRDNTTDKLNVVFRESSGTQHIADVSPYSEMADGVEFDFYIENALSYCKRNGVIYTNNGSPTCTQSNWTSILPTIYSARMGYIRELLPNNTYRSNLIPVKLLKPVPKWLDANGIRRQVGECGMIDLVSGKFYGNVNNVGTFTVENYYKRKEWLVGDESAYIDTNIIVDVPSLYINTSFTKIEGRTTPLFGSRNLVTTSGSQIWYLSDGDLRLDIITNGTDYVNVDSNDIQSYNQLIVDCPNKVVSVNGTTFLSNVDNLSIKNSSNTFKIFSLEVLNNSSTYNKPYNGAFGNFTLNDSTHSLNLIPCTLTMDLPAFMDANNIARTKGTSGMWDLVSDRFYGNVANSGTFKAVNLAEGVDYEVHQWLKGDGSAYIDTLIALKDVTAYKIKAQKDEYYMKSLFGANDSESDRLNVCTYSTGDGVWRVSFGSTDTNLVPFSSDAIEIEWDGSNVYVNEEIKTSISYLTTSTTTCTLFFCKGVPDYRIFNGRIASLTIPSKINLIPVKLLKSIPSKYDANGIARNAGECGMYDTVNDVFYGNVASSGSFTCVNDS